MSLLLQFAESAPDALLQRAEGLPQIAHALEQLGVRFERWDARQPLGESSTQEQILDAYAADIARLKTAWGYRSADVVRLKRDPSDASWPQKAAGARQKFLEEHTHAEDEVRFFVEGSGLFYLRLAGLVTLVLCERGDLLSVPAGTPHWFDMGTDPAFCAIRLFGTEAGWVANFTGDKISARFPSFDRVRQEWR
jgi:1,2-dihydroxy-3-keto-5-methylthiopentene dioxygenase